MITALLAAALAAPPAHEAFSRLQKLSGTWEGTYQWSGARSENGKLTARYSLTGGGAAVVEGLTIGPGDAPSMTSVYHLDGDALRLTHYCAARNQPRLKARTIDLEHDVFTFEFVDSTNLASPDAPHVHGLELQLVDADHLRIVFLFSASRKE